jgi:hypothetical protein
VPSERNYDIFISANENDLSVSQNIEIIVKFAEERKFRVFYPARDIPLGVPDLSCKDTALELSRRAIIVVTQQYLQENLFEAEMIIRSKRADDVLVVVLDLVQLPKWLADRSCVHDWTLWNETMDNRLAKLSDWLFNFYDI